MSAGATWTLEERAGLTLARASGLAAIEGLTHAFSTRRGAFDVGPATAGSAVGARISALELALGLAPGSILLLRQVHGARVVRAAEEARDAPAEADAALATIDERPDRSPAVRTADCVPILLAEERGRAVAAVHAGWRGTAAGVARRTVEALRAAGVRPGALRAAVGPAIGACCYEVGQEVLAAVARASESSPRSLAAPAADGRSRLDLKRANVLQLRGAGLRPEAIEVAPWCTACCPGLFFSHRRDGARAGRMLACLGWSRRAPASP